MTERRRLLIFGLIFFGLLSIVAYYQLASPDTDKGNESILIYKIESLF